MSHHQTAYEDILRAAGHRVTRQRILILDAVCDGGKHTAFGEIYARLRAVDPSIDRSTLYRTLKLFIRLGLVVSAKSGTGETTYEIAAPQPHHHLVCRDCGAEQEISGEVMQAMSDAILSRYGFNVEAAHLMLSGMCATCRASG